MRSYYVIVGDETRGPYSTPELQSLLDRGEIHGDTPVAMEGDDAWQKNQ